MTETTGGYQINQAHVQPSSHKTGGFTHLSLTWTGIFRRLSRVVWLFFVVVVLLILVITIRLRAVGPGLLPLPLLFFILALKGTWKPKEIFFFSPPSSLKYTTTTAPTTSLKLPHTSEITLLIGWKGLGMFSSSGSSSWICLPSRSASSRSCRSLWTEQDVNLSAWW